VDGGYPMSRLARLAALGFALVILQALLISIFPVWMRPDLVLIFALAMGLCGPGSSRLVLAFAFGAAVDVLSAGPMGLFALLSGTACAVTRLVDNSLYLRASGPWASYVAAYVVFNALLLGLVQRLFVEASPLPWLEILLRIPGTAVMMALTSAPLLGLVLRLDAEPVHDSGFHLAPVAGPRSRP
jgi:cell shape-determining protein MreD